MSTQQAVFQDRIARIQSGQPFTKSTIYVGLDSTFSYLPASRGGSGRVGQKLGNAAYALSFPFCMALGFLCHGLERYATFQISGLTDPQASPDVEMVKMAVLGMAFTVVLTHILGLRERGLLVPKLLGVAAGMLFFHNLVHIWPQQFSTVFSTIWVSKVIAMTEPSSMVWRGISFTF